MNKCSLIMSITYIIASISISTWGEKTEEAAAEDERKFGILTDSWERPVNTYITEGEIPNVLVQSQKQWVEGTRLWLSVTIQSNSSKSFNGPLYEYRPFTLDGFSYLLCDEISGECVAWKKRIVRDSLDDISLPPSYTIDNQDGLRLLFPIEWPSENKILGGRYKLKLIIYSYAGAIGKAEIDITVRAPSQEESRILESIKPVGKNRWFVQKEESENFPLPNSLTENTGVNFELMITAMVMRHNSVDEISEEELIGNIPPMFSPEVDFLRYEILKSKNESEAASEMREKLLSQYPGIRFRLDNVDIGIYGPLENLIRERQRWEEQNKEVKAAKVPVPKAL